MDMIAAMELRKEWGNKPCNHPSLEKEYHLGAGTGDYVCTQCGQTRSNKEDFKKFTYKQAENTHSIIDGNCEVEYKVNKSED